MQQTIEFENELHKKYSSKDLVNLTKKSSVTFENGKV